MSNGTRMHHIKTEKENDCPSVRLSVSQYVPATTRVIILRLTFKFYTLRFSQ